jgi:hypothetical protein
MRDVRRKKVCPSLDARKGREVLLKRMHEQVTELALEGRLVWR